MKEREEQREEKEEATPVEGAKEEEPKAKKVEQEALFPTKGTSDMKFVASKSGKKYYALDSTQGKRIKEENRVYFKTKEEAKAAGFNA
jgi:methylphosphotriester-DNA--protein-cysteine methyltransferase